MVKLEKDIKRPMTLFFAEDARQYFVNFHKIEWDDILHTFSAIKKWLESEFKNYNLEIIFYSAN